MRLLLISEQARGVPKLRSFNLLNILVDIKTQAVPNISGQNGKKALDNIIGAIQCKFATFGIANEMKQVNCLGINWFSLLVDVMPNLTLFWLS